MYQNRNIGYEPRTRHYCKPIYSNRQPKSFQNTYELDGQQKFTLKQRYFENLRCPTCIMNNLSQTWKYQGMPWRNLTVNYRTDFKDLYEALHAELDDFYKFIRPNNEDRVFRKATYYCIANSIKRSKKYEIDSVKYYGSYSSNTYLPVSDIDLVVYCDTTYDNVSVLFDIAELLFQDGIIEKHCSLIPNSRIPLLKFYDSVTGLPINITINTPNVMDRAFYIQDEMKHGHPYMIKILYFLKYYLLSKGSNQVFHGGIGSYALTLMVIRYFQEESTKDMIHECSIKYPNTILARLLIGFLQRYSDTEFIRNHTISVAGTGNYKPYVPLPDVPYPGNLFLNKKTSILKIEDHIEPWRNVSSGSFNSDLILNDFGHLLNMLLNPEQCQNDNTTSILANVVAVVDSFVEYRDILTLLYQCWFSDYQGICEKYESYVNNRNIFGKRTLEFDCKRLDDNTVELILMEKMDRIQSFRPTVAKKSAYNFYLGQQMYGQNGDSHIFDFSVPPTRYNESSYNRQYSDSGSQASTENNDTTHLTELNHRNQRRSLGRIDQNYSSSHNNGDYRRNYSPHLDTYVSTIDMGMFRLPIYVRSIDRYSNNKSAFDQKGRFYRQKDKYRSGQSSNFSNYEEPNSPGNDEKHQVLECDQKKMLINNQDNNDNQSFTPKKKDQNLDGKDLSVEKSRIMSEISDVTRSGKTKGRKLQGKNKNKVDTILPSLHQSTITTTNEK
ncbi:Non-canonical poly(A) RNA polymerase papd5 [Blomia tropicalis]|nr:Non-canonical poly(A) RNA polymerase papd5 [Blomia tropicalis]